MSNVLKFPRRKRSEKAIAAAKERKMARLLGKPIDLERIPQAITLLTWAWMAGVDPRHTWPHADGTVLIPTWIVHQHLEKLLASAPSPAIKADLILRREMSPEIDPGFGRALGFNQMNVA
jgi:hypothetical protein